MPELPEVETVCRGLYPVLAGKRILKAEARVEKLRFPVPENFSARVSGQVLRSLSRRGKYLILSFDNGLEAIAHLGMSGRFLINPEDDGRVLRHDHLWFQTESGDDVIFHDPRRFGFFLFAEEEADSHPMIANLGPEPLGNSFHAEALAESLHKKKAPIKTALIDQRLLAGIGNIYASEALYEAGISPRRQAGTIKGRRLERMVASIRSVLERAIESGGSSLRDYRQADGELGYFQHDFKVYGRSGSACLRAGCTGTVQKIIQAGRATYYCSGCQR